MSTVELLGPEVQSVQPIVYDENAVMLPAHEQKRVSIRGHHLNAERITGMVVGSRIKQHNHIHTTHQSTYVGNGQSQVYSTVGNTQWETSEVRLRFQNGEQKVHQLPFPVSVSDGDVLSIIRLSDLRGKHCYTPAAQNHTLGQWFSSDKNDMQRMAAKIGIIKLAAMVGNKAVLAFWALSALILYGAFGYLIVGLIVGFFLTGFYVLGMQYLVLLPYFLSVWPGINRDLTGVFEDFSEWR